MWVRVSRLKDYWIYGAIVWKLRDGLWPLYSFEMLLGVLTPALAIRI